MSAQSLFLFLLLVACLSAVSFKRLKVPYTVGLAVVGFALGIVGEFDQSANSLREAILTPEVILFIFIPPLIFESALHLDSRLLARNLAPILTLAAPGLILSTVLVGLLIAWLSPLTLGQALIFGALISATDPVAVIGLFKELGVAKRLAMLVEGESMLNDAFAIVIFGVLLSLVTASSGASVTVMGTILKFLMSFFGGIAVGAVLGMVMRYAITLTGDNRLVYVTVSLIIAYLAFVTGEHSLHVSGVIAVMTAGLVVAHYNERRLKRTARSYFLGLWEYIAFLANSLIFLLVGLSAAAFFRYLPETEPRFWLWIGYAILVAIAARGVMVFTTTPLLNQLLPKAAVDRRYQGVIFWGGLRGAVALALVLSLSRDFPHRELLIAMTLGVVLFTVVVGGGTTGWLIRRLKLDAPPLVDQLGQQEAMLIARQEMLTGLERIRDVEYVQKPVVDVVKQGYQPALEHAQAAVAKTWQQLETAPHLGREALWLTAIELEQQCYRRFSDQGLLSENVFDRLLLRISFKRDAIQEGRIPPPVLTYEDLEKGSDRLRSRIREYMGAASGRRREQANLEARYEYDIAVHAAAKRVADGIGELAKRQALDLKTAAECEQALTTIGEQALHRLQTFESEQPEVARRLQESLIKRAGAQTAQEVINSLVSAGAISSGASAKVLSELERDAIRETPNQ